ncbi:hypothetical protein Q4Q35_09525 [Flavivirga aquimarina]|uniref:Lipoprotein n=1 Tax=Flavivirga aquimarina TaxID=2027862 RepID=A0ABT8WA74_9FLAO|nr:hypothetical protein [Flavivirga aquimarina]MDO5970048.1 hypothetical protein [Flavivirga aquimarina]
MILRKITLLFSLCLIFGCSSKLVPVEIHIDLKEKKDKTKYENLSIVVKHLGKVETINSLNTIDNYKKGELLKFKNAKIFLNINYGDRNCGFEKVIDQKGKLKYQLYDNGRKKFIDLYFLKDKFKYEELVHLHLNDQINFQQGIHLKDWITDKDTNIIFSSGELFDLSNINQNSEKLMFKDLTINIKNNELTTLWFINKKENEFIEKRKQYAKDLINELNGTTTISFNNLKFYIENSENFKLRKMFQIRNDGKEIIEFE